MYHKLGYETIAFIPTMTSTVLESSARRNASQMLQLIENRLKQQEGSQNEEPSFVAHSFSGNGIYTFGRTLDLAQKSNVNVKYRGLIFDSTPPEIDVDRFARGFVGGIKARSRSGAAQDLDPSFYEHWFLTPLIRCLFGMYLKFYGKDYEEFQDRVLDQMPHRIPSLFIYSDRDVLVPPEDVDAFIAKMEMHGASRIERLHFTDSGHIMHYKEHPEEYERKVETFLQHCDEVYEQKKDNL